MGYTISTGLQDFWTINSLSLLMQNRQPFWQNLREGIISREFFFGISPPKKFVWEREVELCLESFRETYPPGNDHISHQAGKGKSSTHDRSQKGRFGVLLDCVIYSVYMQISVFSEVKESMSIGWIQSLLLAGQIPRSLLKQWQKIIHILRSNRRCCQFRVITSKKTTALWDFTKRYGCAIIGIL